MTGSLSEKQIEHFLGQIELSSGQKQVSDARRDPWRYRWITSGTVELVGSEESSETMSITTRTISPEGLDFRCPRSLEPGCKVLINLKTDEGDLRIPAIVKHCTESVGMPTVGVIFDLEDDS